MSLSCVDLWAHGMVSPKRAIVGPLLLAAMVGSGEGLG
jgi:hypothetical protein